jgi:hypothetical protein
MGPMAGLQQIIYQGQLAAVVIGEQATIEARLSGEELLDVQAMCLYAIEIAARRLPGSYSQERAEAFAGRARAQRAVAAALQRTGRGAV